MILSAPDALRGLLARTRTIAVVGASPRPGRPSHGVFRSLRADGRFTVVPVTPSAPSVDGVAAFADLFAYAQAHGAPDLVDVFRATPQALDAARDAIAVGAKAIWFQLGIVNDEAIALADRAGLDVVVDRCLGVDARALR